VTGPAGRSAAGIVLLRLRDFRPWQPTTFRAMVTSMTDETSSVPPAGTRLQRPRGGRVLGGVCVAVARSLGVKPVLVRSAAVVLAMVTGGSALLAYLLAWVLIPQEEAGRAGPDTTASRGVVSPQRSADAAAASPGAGGARAAWSTAGKELRALAGELRPALEAPQEGAMARRSPVAAVDVVLTGVGERLRDPAVQESARRSAGRLAAAVSASADAVSPATRRAGAAVEPVADRTGRSGTAG
jgi:phage shock protein PspC (stress-responsive transcriptional regulator)